MRLFLVRHGETDWNVEKRLQGRTDIPLNKNGIELAKVTGEALREVPFDLAFSSPLKRAVETAELILGERSAKVITDERIIEISFGIYEGLSSGKGHYEIPDPNFRSFFLEPGRYCPPKGGESLQQLMDRTRDFITELVARREWEDKTILITTHGAAVRGLINAASHNPVENFWNGRVPKNCSVSVVESHSGNMELIRENVVYA